MLTTRGRTWPGMVESHICSNCSATACRFVGKGMSVDDRFELTRLVMYDGGSVFEVNRSNEVLRASGIEKLHHTWKAHSSNCVISHMVLYLPFGDVGASECRYWETLADELAAGTTQTLNPPEICSE